MSRGTSNLPTFQRCMDSETNERAWQSIVGKKAKPTHVKKPSNSQTRRVHHFAHTHDQKENGILVGDNSHTAHDAVFIVSNGLPGAVWGSGDREHDVSIWVVVKLLASKPPPW
ncbi:hypothetical protein H310_15306 [Aphanomyces invadans]|uniref:Uncharacterized protein n=1 Tax=Aphanomyces invadans TaxID=157072 RepID=A0A024T8E9_9STRA|nr:hypothetical protein H310_15306 [Aphanomyces invadans]ETV89856.1 hypothetical protein H310_15306 [Aphanomyces invadans]|eukprot:XP_008881513.1 hypothetical protein H310_15306 [Aphanomyces invadans]